MMSRTARALTGALCFSLAAMSAHAQEAAPLHKGDLVRFLTGSTYTKPEIAAIIRRACLAFGPTSRDYANLKDLGATQAVIGAMQNCVENGNKVARAEIATPAPIRPMEIELPYRGVSATAGTVALYTVTIHRGATPLSGVRLLLHGSRDIPGGTQAELNANTDRDGHATFSIAAGSTAGTYPLKIADADGVELRGVVDFVLTTIPAAPSLAKVSPQTLDIGAAARGTSEITVTVTDPFSNPVPQLPVVLKRYPPRGAAALPTQITDNAGIAHFSIQTAPLQDGDSIVVTVKDRAYATVRVTAAAEITNLLLEAERRLSEGSLSAEGAYDSVLTVDPNNKRALIGRGYIRSAQSKFDPATQDFTAALTGDDRASALTGLGYVALRRNDLATASARFDEALKLDPGDDGAATGRAYAELWRLDPRQAPHRAAALSSPRPVSYPADAASQLRAGVDFFAARNAKSAEKSLSAAAAAAPTWADVYYERALARQADGQTSLAMSDFNRYLQLRPNAVDRSDVEKRMGALNRSPGKAFALGILPGGGQFYTHQPVIGIVVLGGVAASAVWALKSTPKMFTDPFGHPYQNGTERKNLTKGAAVGGGIWLLGAIEAAIHASSARGDPYPPPAAVGVAPTKRSELPHISPTVGFDDRGARVGAAFRFSIR